MAHDLFSSSSSESSVAASLVVRDGAGHYRPTAPAEVLQAALHVLEGQLRGSEILPRVGDARLDVGIGKQAWW